MSPYEHGVTAALTKLGMVPPVPPPQQGQQGGGGGIGGVAKNILSGGMFGSGGLMSGGMGIPGTGKGNAGLPGVPGGGMMAGGPGLVAASKAEVPRGTPAQEAAGKAMWNEGFGGSPYGTGMPWKNA
jgi:hypothetical protein